MRVCVQKRSEVAKLEAAVSSQAQSVEDLGTLVSGARLSEDGQSLLLTLADGKVRGAKARAETFWGGFVSPGRKAGDVRLRAQWR